MDNSATSYPKPECVVRAVKKAVDVCFANPGRSTFREAIKSSEIVYDARVQLARLVGTVPENVVFTYNATYALNMAIRGTVKKGMTVAVDRFAHNSVLRPLYDMESQGVTLEILETDLIRDSVIISAFERLVKAKKIDVLVLTHTSNVTGKRLPIKRLSQICKKHGTLLIVDASQGLGSSNIDIEKQGIDILASSGHKGLYGIMGTGFLAVSKSCNRDIIPIVSGGSGIFSLEKGMPELLPERLEAGTLGVPGIVSMKVGAEFLSEVGVDEIGYREKLLRSYLTEGLSVIKGVRLLNEDVNANSIVLFNFFSASASHGAELLEREGIAFRSGYHCAPLVHDIISSGREGYDGAIRLSVGYFNTKRQCDKVLKSVTGIAKNLAIANNV